MIPASDELRALLRHWRGVRGKSQLDLSLASGVSQRHISFIEGGRSAPGRETLIDLAEALDIPLGDRNTLLLAAGYAPIYPEGGWDAPEMRGVTAALRRVLRQHEPFPALVMDRYWDVLLANDAAPRFFGRFVDLAARPGPRNMLHLMFDPAGMRPFVANWEEVARALIGRVHRESVGRVVDGRTRDLLASLLAYPGVKPEWKGARPSGGGAPSPVITMNFLEGPRTLNYFSMVTTVGTPRAVAAQEIRIESMFPADEATEARHVEMMGQSP